MFVKKCPSCNEGVGFSVSVKGKGQCHRCGLNVIENESRVKVLVIFGFVCFLLGGSIPLPYYILYVAIIGMTLSLFRKLEIKEIKNRS